MRSKPIVEEFGVDLLGGSKFKVAKREEGSGLDLYDIVLFGASCDDVETNKKFAEALKLDYPILCDLECKVAKEFGIAESGRSFPGRVTFYIGPDGKLLFVDTKVNAREHGAQIVKRLEELKVPKKEKKGEEDKKESKAKDDGAGLVKE